MNLQRSFVGKLQRVEGTTDVFYDVGGSVGGPFPDARASSEKAERLIGDTLPHVDCKLAGFSI